MPPPLRGDSPSEILGLPDVSPSDVQKIKLGNQTARWVIRVFRLAARRGIPVVIENPANSRLGLAPPVRTLIHNFKSATFTHCMYGSQFKKATKLLYANIDLSPLSRHCRGRVCQVTQRPHVALSGKVEGIWCTAKASAYPWEFCRAFCRVLLSNFSPPSLN